ncbi:MAG: hypothetical protein GY816_18805 [Cytophagales bacterium]|nr:hypothetical protein [Cytophagales bacterium]
MSGMIARAYKIFTWLSLDVTVGAIVFMHFLSQELGTPVLWIEAAALGLAVWVIYSVDHLLDSSAAVEPISPRRLFHQQHTKVLLLLTALALTAGIWMASLLSRNVIISGGILAIIAVGYLVAARYRRWSDFKEIQIALGYAIGVSLVPVTKLEAIESWHWLSIILLLLTAFINLILFSWFERKQDQDEGFTSMVLTLGEKKISVILILAFVMILLGAITLFQIGGSLNLAIFLLLTGGINSCLWKFTYYFGKNSRYRAVGDAVFLLPLFWLL